ncbi:MAG: hypothetical protein JRG94_19765 [Deltaproteobacteria bacterium]|nr:hypothetical protein [Deltaproteobacteria bacterium]
MDYLSILCILIGTLIIATRGPLIFAPRAMLRLIRWLIATDARLRGIGLVLTVLAAAPLLLPLGEGPVAGGLYALGWLLAFAALWLLFAPGPYRLVAQGVLDYVDGSVDEAIVRILGILAVAIGVALVYVGIYVV